jgi:hypothetical protein
MMRLWIAAGACLAAAGALVPNAGFRTPEPSCECRRLPAATGRSARVESLPELRDALGRAQAGDTIFLAAGRYPLDRTIELDRPGVSLRGETGSPADVVLHGGGIDEGRVGVALSVSAPDVTIADLSVGEVGFHGIQVRGESGASRVLVHNVRVFDTGQQLLKGSIGTNGLRADAGVVACSTFEYTTHAPSDYTNGVDVLTARDWVVRGNRFVRIRGPEQRRWSAGPAVLFWRGSAGTLVERNIFVDCFRGIALGLEPAAAGDPTAEGPFDHAGGSIRTNVLWNLNGWADEGIEANAARGVEIDHNTVMHLGLLPWSISVRFSGTIARVRNNLTARAIVERNGAQALPDGNVAGATSSWFVDAAAGDLRLRDATLPAIDIGVPLADLTEDFDCRPRRSGKAPDAGAYEFSTALPLRRPGG